MLFRWTAVPHSKFSPHTFNRATLIDSWRRQRLLLGYSEQVPARGGRAWGTSAQQASQHGPPTRPPIEETAKSGAVTSAGLRWPPPEEPSPELTNPTSIHGVKTFYCHFIDKIVQRHRKHSARRICFASDVAHTVIMGLKTRREVQPQDCLP